MRKCESCNGRGWIFVPVGNIGGEVDVDKDICLECMGEGKIKEKEDVMSSPNDEIPCSKCEDGVLVEEGSPHENANGEDDSQYLKCNKCGALYNENGQYLSGGK